MIDENTTNQVPKRRPGGGPRKLKPGEAEAIRASKEHKKDLAKRYGISTWYVWALKAGVRMPSSRVREGRAKALRADDLEAVKADLAVMNAK